MNYSCLIVLFCWKMNAVPIWLLQHHARVVKKILVYFLGFSVAGVGGR